MEDEVKRPLVVWITQVVLALSGSLIFLLLLFATLLSVLEGKPPSRAEYLSDVIPLGLFILLEFSAVTFLVSRKRLGRLLACIVLFGGPLLLLLPLLPIGDVSRSMFFLLVICVAPFLLAFSLFVNREAAEYFAPQHQDLDIVIRLD